MSEQSRRYAGLDFFDQEGGARTSGTGGGHCPPGDAGVTKAANATWQMVHLLRTGLLEQFNTAEAGPRNSVLRISEYGQAGSEPGGVRARQGRSLLNPQREPESVSAGVEGGSPKFVIRDKANEIPPQATRSALPEHLVPARPKTSQ